MNISIHPFVAGVLTVLCVEFVALFIAGCVKVKKDKRNKEMSKNGNTRKSR